MIWGFETTFYAVGWMLSFIKENCVKIVQNLRFIPKKRQSLLLNDRVLRKHCVNVPRPRNTHEFMDREVVVTVSVAKLEFSRSVAVCIDPPTTTNAT